MENKCCQNNKGMGFNYCPDCGMFMGKSEFNLFVPAKIENDNTIIRDREFKETHPSYAQLQISRISGSNEGRKTLFGSAIRHQHTIKLQIHEAAKYYDDYNERYFGFKQPYIEIEMSQNQFAEAITSMNMGTGIPVTLRYLMGKPIPLCEELTMRQKIDKKVASNFHHITSRITKAHARIDELQEQKGPLKASEKNELIELCRSLVQELNSNLPFFKQTIDEAIDKSITQGKAELDASAQYLITRLGMERIVEIAATGSLDLLGEK
jgi:hypothetical protein